MGLEKHKSLRECYVSDKTTVSPNQPGWKSSPLSISQKKRKKKNKTTQETNKETKKPENNNKTKTKARKQTNNKNKNILSMFHMSRTQPETKKYVVWTSQTLWEHWMFFILSCLGYGQNSKVRLMRTQSTTHCRDRPVLNISSVPLDLVSLWPSLPACDGYPRATGPLEVPCDEALSVIIKFNILAHSHPVLWRAVMIAAPLRVSSRLKESCNASLSYSITNWGWLVN